MGDRRWLARAAPGASLGAAGMLGVATGAPIVGLAAAIALLVATPWGRSLAVRAMLGLLVVLALASVVLRVPALRWDSAGLVLLLAGLTALQATVAVLRAGVPLLPRIPAADAVALGGAAATTGMLAAPYVGRATDDIVLELARGFDAVNHLLAVTNLVAEQGSAWAQPAWPSPDGSPAQMAGYPLGYHAVVAGALELAGVGRSRDLVVAYAWAAVLALGVCAALLGWVAARVAVGLGPPGRAGASASWAALGYSACLVLGGSFVAPFVLGHAPFLVAATAGIVASWLALELLATGAREVGRGRRGRRESRFERPGSRAGAAALAVLGLGLVGLVGAYPPLASGLVPAGVIWVWHWSEAAASRWLRPVALAAILLTLVGLLWLWRRRIDHLVSAVGENSTPFVVSTVLVVLTGGAAWAAWERGWGLAPARALAVAVGYLSVALVLAVAAVLRGLAPAESYYGTKLAEAAWLAALPVVAALLSAALLRVPATDSGFWRVAIPGAGMLWLAVLVGVLPVGRSDSLLVGPGVLGQRLVEARRAQGQVQVVEAAQLAGPSTGDASGILEPQGWFYPVAHDDAPYPQWRRDAGTAALWLATLRGVRTEVTDSVAACFLRRGGVESLPCVGRWLAADSARRITLVVSAGPTVRIVGAWRVPRADQVRLVVLPAGTG